jgi:hypothetical protein
MKGLVDLSAWHIASKHLAQGCYTLMCSASIGRRTRNVGFRIRRANHLTNEPCVHLLVRSKALNGRRKKHIYTQVSLSEVILNICYAN